MVDLAALFGNPPCDPFDCNEPTDFAEFVGVTLLLLTLLVALMPGDLVVDLALLVDFNGCVGNWTLLADLTDSLLAAGVWCNPELRTVSVGDKVDPGGAAVARVALLSVWTG